MAYLLTHDKDQARLIQPKHPPAFSLEELKGYLKAEDLVLHHILTPQKQFTTKILVYNKAFFNRLNRFNHNASREYLRGKYNEKDYFFMAMALKLHPRSFKEKYPYIDIIGGPAIIGSTSEIPKYKHKINNSYTK